MDARKDSSVAFAILAAALCAGLAGAGLLTGTAVDSHAAPGLHQALGAVNGEAPADSRGPDAGLENPARTRVAPAGESWLRVLGVEDAQPIVGARVRLPGPSHAADSAFEGFSGELGRLPIPAGIAGRRRIEVRCDGFVPLAGELVLDGAGEQRVALERGGSVRLTLRDRAGSPVEGAEVVLLPPLLHGAEWNAGWIGFGPARGPNGSRELDLHGGTWRATDRPISFEGTWSLSAHFAGLGGTWRARTDADGTVVWQGLPESGEYRFGLLPPRHGDLRPPHEGQPLREVGRSVEVKAAPARGLSGRIDVVAGATAEVGATILRPARVFGRVMTTGAASAARVKLYRVRQAGGEVSTGVTSFDFERVATADAAGRFAFEDLRPALWIVRACWREGERDVHFSNCTFRLTEAADLGLGELRALQGHEVRVQVDVADTTGRRVAPAAVFQNPDIGHAATVICNLVPDSLDANDAVFEAFAMPFGGGGELALHGLVPGRVHLMAHAGPELLPEPERVCEVHPSEEVRARLASLGPVTLDLRVELGISRELRVTDMHGAHVPLSSVWVRDLRSGRAWSAPIRPANDGGTETVTLPEGEYEIHCAIAPGNTDHPGALGSVRAKFAEETRGPLGLELQPGVTVRGVLLDAAGAPVPRRTLQWTLPGWQGKNATIWLYAAHTDAEGRFAVAGLPVATPLVGSADGTDLPAFGAGTHNGVELHLSPAAPSAR